MLKKVLMLGLVLFAVFFRLYLYDANINFDGTKDWRASDFGQFRVESAVRYHYAQMISGDSFHRK